MGAYVVEMRNRMERAEAAAENEAIVSRDLRKALQLAVRMLAPHEPPDSRAVSDEFVALAAVADMNDMSPRVMLVIESALAKQDNCYCGGGDASGHQGGCPEADAQR